MNDCFRLNGEMVRAWLAKDRRKHGYLADRLHVGDATVGRMLAGRVPKYATLKALAEIMGVEVNALLLPRDDQKRSA